MHTSLKIIAVLMLLVPAIAVRSFAASTGSCSASSFLGGTCNTDCQTGTHPVCVGNFFSSSCSCVPDGSQNNLKTLILPVINPQQVILAQQFILWAHGSASPALQQLGTLAENSTAALQQRNVQAFSIAEYQFGQAWQSLPFPDQQATANWRMQHGLGN